MITTITDAEVKAAAKALSIARRCPEAVAGFPCVHCYTLPGPHWDVTGCVRLAERALTAAAQAREENTCTQGQSPETLQTDGNQPRPETQTSNAGVAQTTFGIENGNLPAADSTTPNTNVAPANKRGGLKAPTHEEREVMPIAAVGPHDPTTISDAPPGPAPDTQGRADDGWQLVPKVPTPEMERAIFCFPLGARRFEGTVTKDKEVVNTDTSLAIYRAMLAAAPSPPDQSDRIAALERQLAEAREVMRLAKVEFECQRNWLDRAVASDYRYDNDPALPGHREAVAAAAGNIGEWLKANGVLPTA